jgi:tetratricopeptide (TPR) repeat protein
MTMQRSRLVGRIMVVALTAIALVAPVAPALAAPDRQPNAPVTAQDFYQRGVVRALLGDDPRGAIADFDEALRRDPDEASVYHHRANARAQIGDLQGAIQDFTTAMQLEPALADNYAGRGRARTRIGDVQGALADLERAADMYLAQGDRLARLRYQQAAAEAGWLRRQ